jgi:hypothetical protein
MEYTCKITDCAYDIVHYTNKGQKIIFSSGNIFDIRAKLNEPDIKKIHNVLMVFNNKTGGCDKAANILNGVDP